MLDQGLNTTAANISTRGLVQTDDNVLIGGLIVGGGPAGAEASVVVRRSAHRWPCRARSPILPSSYATWTVI